MAKDFDLYVAVAIGGAIGASARYSMELAIPTASDGWPTATFLVNLSGAFILGMIVVLGDVFFPDPKLNALARRFRPFVVTGILGGYTTFSTYIVEAHGLMINNSDPKIGLGILYLVSSVILGLICVAAGMLVMRALLRSRLQAAEQGDH